MAEGLIHVFGCCKCGVILPVTLRMGLWNFTGQYRPDLQEHNSDNKYRSAWWCDECLEKKAKPQITLDKTETKE